MRGIQLNDSFVQSCLGSAKKVVVETKKVTESKEVETEVEGHVCPLCESTLEAPISQERLEEHVDTFLNIINESFQVEGDSLDEETEEDSEDDAK